MERAKGIFEAGTHTAFWLSVSIANMIILIAGCSTKSTGMIWSKDTFGSDDAVFTVGLLQGACARTACVYEHRGLVQRWLREGACPANARA